MNLTRSLLLLLFPVFILVLSSSATPVDTTTITTTDHSNNSNDNNNNNENTTCETTLAKFRTDLKALSPSIHGSLDSIRTHYPKLTEQGLQPDVDRYVDTATKSLPSFDQLTQMPDDDFTRSVSGLCTAAQPSSSSAAAAAEQGTENGNVQVDVGAPAPEAKQMEPKPESVSESSTPGLSADVEVLTDGIEDIGAGVYDGARQLQTALQDIDPRIGEVGDAAVALVGRLFSRRH